MSRRRSPTRSVLNGCFSLLTDHPHRELLLAVLNVRTRFSLFCTKTNIPRQVRRSSGVHTGRGAWSLRQSCTLNSQQTATSIPHRNSISFLKTSVFSSLNHHERRWSTQVSSSSSIRFGGQMGFTVPLAGQRRLSVVKHV